MQFLIRCCFLSVLLSVAFLSGCATIVRPDDLKKPEMVTCLEVPKGVEAHEVKGLFDYRWTTRLAHGPYIAELEDAEGIYYRAPPGGIFVGPDDIDGKPLPRLQPWLFDGGIWVPRASDKAPHLYTYFSTQDATVAQLPAGASCATAVSVPDPNSKGVSVVVFATEGALGGAIGGAVARAASQNSSMSYGQSAGAGLIGGAIAGVIIAGLINMDVGKIVHSAPSTDPKFRAALGELVFKIVQIPAGKPSSGESADKAP